MRNILVQNKGKKNEFPIIFPVLMFVLIIFTIILFKYQFSVDWIEATDFNYDNFRYDDVHKDYLLYFYADNCDYCGMMERTTFRSRDVVRRVGRYYVAIKVNVDTVKEITLDKTYTIEEIYKHCAIRGIPAVVLYSPSESLQDQPFFYWTLGYRDRYQFLVDLDEGKSRRDELSRRYYIKQQVQETESENLDDSKSEPATDEPSNLKKIKDK